MARASYLLYSPTKWFDWFRNAYCNWIMFVTAVLILHLQLTANLLTRRLTRVRYILKNALTSQNHCQQNSDFIATIDRIQCLCNLQHQYQQIFGTIILINSAIDFISFIITLYMIVYYTAYVPALNVEAFLMAVCANLIPIIGKNVLLVVAINGMENELDELGIIIKINTPGIRNRALLNSV